MADNNITRNHPLPWRATPPQGAFGWEVVDARGEMVCMMSRYPGEQHISRATAEFIVEMANNS